MRKILKQKNFKNYGLSISTGTLAASLLSLSIYWYILETTQSVTALAVTGFVQSLPALFSLVVSTYADKYNAKIIMVFSDFLRGSMSILILVNIFTFKSIIVIIILNMVIEFAELIHNSATTSIIPNLISNKRIEQGVGTSNAIISISELVGVGLGGIIYGVIGVKVLFFIVIALFVLAIWFGLRIVIDTKSQQNKELIENENTFERQTFKQSIKYISENKLLLRIVLVSLIVNISFAAFDIVLTVHVYNYMNQGAEIYGLMSGALMLGMILGSVLIGKLAQKISISKMLIVGFIFCGLFLVLLGIVDFWVLGGLLTLGIGFFMAVIDSSIDSWLLRLIPEKIRGSIINMLMAISSITLPLGSALFGYLMGKLSSTKLFVLMGVIVLIGITTFYLTGLKEQNYVKKIEEE